ncbi:YceI-like protein [Formosa agariphila KMM 3901]|uniref:YceI-like protein n=1 Tax=Formosa agariphila (strain DSM 15362 / KCTC 12365 / LMG 23005 / KMM 3901 / M-2Alg 35-1) TaxID=1347342 RepID=T2KJ46_FORAG|nr:YceI family protein [Formosa agariphila]CDF78441.1 YceI-like protein [Formosa agariphila KMM 3901]
MKNRLLTLLCVLSIGVSVTSCKDKAKEAGTTAAEPVATSANASTEYKINTEKSTIEWKGFKPTGTHNGTINIESGTLSATDNSIQSGTVVIDMNSIVALDVDGDKKDNLEAHLKGTVEGKEGDFFNVNKYPTASFVVTGVSKNDAGKTMLSGNLKMKDIEKNVSFPVTVTVDGESLSLVSETFTIDRTLWGVNFGSKSVFDNLGDKFINDGVELTIEINASKS